MLQTVMEVAEVSQKMAYSVEEFSGLTTLSKAYLRNEIRDGNLKAKKVGRRVLILQNHAEEYLNNFPNVEQKKNKGEK